MASPLVSALIAGGATAAGGGGVGATLKAGATAAAFDISPGFKAFETLRLGGKRLELEATRIRELQKRTGIAEQGLGIRQQQLDLSTQAGVREQERLDIAEAQEVDRAKEEARRNEEKSIDAVLPGIDKDQIQMLEALIGDVIDEDTRTFQVGRFEDRFTELQKTNPRAIEQIMKKGVANANTSLQAINGNINEEIGKVIEAQAKLGKTLNKEDIIKDPSLHSTNLSKLLQVQKESQDKRDTNNRFLSLFRKEVKRPREFDFAIKAAGLNPDVVDFSTMTEDEAEAVLIKAKEFGKATFDDFIDAMINANQGGARPPGFLERILRFASSLRTGGELPLITEAPKSLSEGDFATGDQAILDTVTEGLR